MIDSMQLLTIIGFSVLTTLVVVLGVQVFFILSELRKTIEKVNKVISDAGSISESVSKPISMISSIITGIKVGSGIKNFLHQEDEEKE